MRTFLGISLVVTGIFATTAGAEMVEVTIENLAPRYGTYQTPFWVGFHNGGFDVFDAGAAASMEVERFAEDGNFDPLQMLFAGSGMGAADGLVAPGGPFAPGDFASMMFDVSGNDPKARYFSFASMVIPSNDAFVGNDNAMAYQIFDDDGNFIGADFFIAGSEIYDAGTEVNDEIPDHTAFFGQSMPDSGVDENGVVHMHPGYLGSFGNPGDNQSILADPMFAGADFTLPDYPVARVTVTPAPGAMALLGLAGLAGVRRRRTG
jgi:MYXO-CTERM domain-containing protein